VRPVAAAARFEIETAQDLHELSPESIEVGVSGATDKNEL
jgi:hypothetical protein